MDKTVVEEGALDTREQGPQEEDDEHDVIEPAESFTDSEDDVNDDDFLYDRNDPDRIAVGLNSDPVVEEQNAEAIGEDSESDNSYDPTAEELETDYSSDEETPVRYPIFNEEKELWDPEFEVGKTFTDVTQFRKAIQNHGVATGCNLRLKTNDCRRAQAVCKLGCNWRIWASENKKLNCIQIKSYNPNHNCIRDGRNRHCTAKYVAERYLETFRVDTGWKASAIRLRVLQDLKINIVRQTAWRARRIARIMIEGSDEHQFGLLWSFAEELLRTNPGSTCRIALHESQFQGIYVCLDACKKGFVSGCRQLIGLDGCFLKGTFGGQMLVAVALDANDCIYPIAFAIVEKENTSSWRWFIRNLGGDLKIVNCNEWTFMSDRQKGLQNVIEDMYPNAEHRFCVRHIYTNFFRAEFKGLALKEILWKAAKSTTVADHMFWMKEMEKQSKPAYEWLLKKDPKEWSKSHFMTRVKSDIVLNNLCECFNKVVLDDREKSIVTMLIDMHISCMKRIQCRRDKMRKVVGPLCPKIHAKLVKNMDMASGSMVDWSGGPQWYVRSRDGEFVVDIESRTCTCRKWELTGIPCAHACAAIVEKRDQPSHYVHDCYKVTTYMSCYENLVMPLNGKKLWAPVDREPIRPPGWNVARRGRRQQKRRLQAEEIVVKQKGGTSKMKRLGTLTMTCSLCGLSGHNKRYHDRSNVSNEEFFAQGEDQPILDCGSQTVSKTSQSRAKIQPRRCKKSDSTPSNEPQQSSSMRFMPTPGIIEEQTRGPAVVLPGNEVEKNLSIDNMVDDLQLMQHEEHSRLKAQRAKNVRDKVRLHATRNRKPA